jgi:hypothetical protein
MVKQDEGALSACSFEIFAAVLFLSRNLPAKQYGSKQCSKVVDEPSPTSELVDEEDKI